MKQVNKIAHLVVLLYFALSLVIFLSFDSIKGLMGIEDLSSSLVINILLVGLILFLISWATSTSISKGLTRDLEKKDIEKNELKAKLYDLEQGIKLKNMENRLRQKEEEKESSVIRPRQNFK
ncbi:hypothetical protein [Cecembia rubra]|uniref:Uncharacterized protein n=1 Tax=Cecembia rubra TaxID=1485585 RepID=A0A2P8DNH0_9BACT|nr:hypothetical protein [Cecembia rubra]PSK98749.1 hypothetical protein CLV48_11836 [Cecembia rubra]